MNIVKHNSDIYEVENFLTEEEVKGLLLSANPDGFIRSHPGNIVQDFNAESLTFIPSISDRLMTFFKNAHSHTKISNIRRLHKGEYMSAHEDSGYPDSPNKIVFGIAIYLNEDFSGGSLRYTDLDIDIKPKTASMVIHNAKLKHEVLPVTDGARYSITTFVFGDDTTTVNI